MEQGVITDSATQDFDAVSSLLVVRPLNTCNYYLWMFLQTV